MNVELFANTGVQFINTEIPCGPTEGWEFVKNTNTGDIWKWLRIQNVGNLLVLAVDTSTGPDEEGYFCADENSIANPVADIDVVIPGDDNGDALSLSISILPSRGGDGDPIDVALVLDFGNCRGLGVLVDQLPTNGEKLPASPFRLYSSDEQKLINTLQRSELVADQHGEVCFSTSMEFVAPEIDPLELTVTRTSSEPHEVKKRGLFKTTIQLEAREVTQDTVVTSGLFPQISPVRTGKEAKDIRLLKAQLDHMRLSGMSSPKRYVWDDRRLDGEMWHQRTVKSISEVNQWERVQGRYYAFAPEDDRNWSSVDELRGDSVMTQRPEPKFPRRAVLVAQFYEILCQAFLQINSIRSRSDSLHPRRKRNLTDLVMAYPSGMCREEVQQYRKQVEKAVAIFSKTHLHSATPRIELHCKLDEGSAGQLAYVFGEIKMLGSSKTWFQTVGRNGKTRIANLDIGGGTTDLMIADYEDHARGPATDLHCITVHQDGISRGGDHLVQALLERELIPMICRSLSMSPEQAATVFTGNFGGQVNLRRKIWLDHIFLPLAYQYMERTISGNTQTPLEWMTVVGGEQSLLDDFDHTVAELIQDAGFKSISDVNISYETESFDQILTEVFGDILDHYTSVIAEADCDIVLLSGKGSDIKLIQKFVHNRLSLPSDRIVPLGDYYTGTWYPIQNGKRPGRIADPKSVVAVGAAIDFLASTVGLDGFLFQRDQAEDSSISYYWGHVDATNPKFLNRDTIFQPSQQSSPEEIGEEIEITGPKMFFGRRQTANERMQVAPHYCIEVDPPLSTQGVAVRLKRMIIDGDECLQLDSVRPLRKTQLDAPIEEYVRLGLRTMFDDLFFVDDILALDFEQITD
jgi:hypothetical protein